MVESGWSINLSGGGTVTLPHTPEFISEENPVAAESVGVDDGTSVLVSQYREPRVLTLEGFAIATNNGTVESTYLSPLRAMVGKACTITSPNSQYGGTWVMCRFGASTEAGDLTTKFNYRLEFALAGAHIINIT